MQFPSIFFESRFRPLSEGGFACEKAGSRIKKILLSEIESSTERFGAFQV
jgi:hypothetical protein